MMADENTQSILLVDDDPAVALKYRYQLSDYGLVTEAPNAKSALEHLSRLRYDVVLMDMRLSVGGCYDGIEASTVIKRLFDVPVMYLTAYSDPDTLARVRASDYECDGYLIKGEEKSLRVALDVGMHCIRERRLGRRELTFAVDKDLRLTSASRAMQEEIFGEYLSKSGRLPHISDISGLARCGFRDDDLMRAIEKNSFIRVCIGRDSACAVEMDVSPVKLGSELLGFRSSERARLHEPSALEAGALGCESQPKTVALLSCRVIREKSKEFLGCAEIECVHDGRSVVRLIPTRRLEAIGAAFPDARISYEVSEFGATSMSRISYIGHEGDRLRKEGPDMLSDSEYDKLDE
ncbi:MAG: response regulator [Planctomycetaceae bacterium]|nr:response regulator [Planctomycetaceae bacterium]